MASRLPYTTLYHNMFPLSPSLDHHPLLQAPPSPNNKATPETHTNSREALAGMYLVLMANS